jgi:hypothetical protein
MKGVFELVFARSSSRSIILKITLNCKSKPSSHSMFFDTLTVYVMITLAESKFLNL